MAGRALAFSDPDIIQILSERFIPVAENCSPLQRQPDAEGEFFRLVAEQGHYAGRTFPTDTRQGYYACTAGGTLLATGNSRQPRAMQELLQTALRRWELWRAVATAAGTVLPDYLPARPERYPADGLVLRLTARDLPRAIDTRADDWRRAAWNLDYAWFTAAEARAMVPASRTPGSRQLAPDAVARRIARFHLRDFVRGEPPIWPAEAIRRAELEATVVDVAGPANSQVRLAFHGGARLETEWRWHDHYQDEDRHSAAGLDLTFRGEATWDDRRAAFTAFDLLAAGPRWGATQHNNRADDPGPAPLGIAFSLAGKEPRDRTPPHAIRHREYFGDDGRG